MTYNRRFLNWLRTQVGKKYKLGSEVILLDVTCGNPNAFSGMLAWDCSELVQAGLWVAGVRMIGRTSTKLFDGAGNQYLCCPHHIPVETAVKIPGCLLFVQDVKTYPDRPANIGHVAVVVAAGQVIEARGKRYGVLQSPVRPSFNRAAKITELFEEESP